MAKAMKSADILRFGVFELHLQAGELRKDGLKVRLQEQPFRVLALLLEKPGEVVTREELREKLWSDDTYVDFDKSINATVKKVREALGDVAENPRFVQTLHRRGYRFIAPVQSSSGGNPKALGKRDIESPSEFSARGRRNRFQTWKGILTPRRWPGSLSFGLGVVTGLIILAAWHGLTNTNSVGEQPLRKFAFTPYGARIVYVQEGGEARIWIQDLEKQEAYEVQGTPGAGRPFWSPDSEFVGFGEGRELRKISLQSGAITTVCSLPQVENRQGMQEPRGYRGGAWSLDGETIVFSVLRQGIYEVSASGGAPRLIVDVPDSRSISFLDAPTGERILLYASRTGGRFGPSDVVVHSLVDGQRKVVLTEETVPPEPVYSPSGHLLYRRFYAGRRGIWAIRLSTDTWKATGEAFPVAHDGLSPTVSREGNLVYLEDRAGGRQQLAWRDRRGLRIEQVGQPQTEIREPALSPDGLKVAVMGRESYEWDIWLQDLLRGSKMRLTFHPVIEAKPIWSPTGDKVVYISAHGDPGEGQLYITGTDGSGLTAHLANTEAYASDWSRDGVRVAFHRQRHGTSWDIGYLEKSRNDYQIQWFLEGPFAELEAQFSPDGRYVAYCSDESGRFEVYVRQFPNGQGRWQASRNGGAGPRWRRDGKELFFVEGESLKAVRVTTEPEFLLGPEEVLFEHASLRSPYAYLLGTM